MRHLLTAILVLAIATMTFVTCYNKCSSDVNDSNNTATSDTIDNIPEAEQKYCGDTLYQYDGKTIVYDYGFEWEDRPFALSTSAIITYRDTTPIDTCRVIGNGTWIVNGDNLDFAIGVDTVSYPFRKLPKSVDPERDLLSKDIVMHTYHHSFELTDSSRNCDFSFFAYLPKNHPAWIKQIIATVIRNDIQAIFLDNKGSGKILNEYLGIKKKPKKISGINAYSMTPEQIAKHFAKDFEKHYKKEFTIADCDGVGPKYDYMLTVSPAWNSKDGKLVTYRFYSYYYTSGMHGYMEEYYLTFDSESGRMLGWKDIFTDKGFKSAIRILEQMLYDYKKTYTTCEEPYPAHLGKSELEANASETIKEIHDSVYYPRPALTNSGVVFSYQPYEMGAFSEGILHFPIPYKQLSLKIKR